MTTSTESHVRFDPYDVELIADPYPMFARLRDEAPLYYNAEYDFFAVSRFADVNKALVDHTTFSSARGAILELIKANLEIPSGMLIFEDPPIHDVHRKLLSRMFTPRKISALEPMIREFCAQALDPLVGSGRFDFVTDLGAQMPMKVISALLGIPEDDQEYIRDRANAQLRTEAGKPMQAAEKGLSVGEQFAAYIDWRADNPSDDIMTELLNVEFADETGATRRLTRDEILVYLNVVAGAGNETTTRLIGWAGKVLADHPDQRRDTDDIQNVVSGNAWIHHGWNGDVVNVRNQVKKPENYSFQKCKEGLPVGTDFFAIPANAQHPGTALTFINFLLEPENASANIEYMGYPMPYKGPDETFANLVKDDPAIDVTVDDLTNGQQYASLGAAGRARWDQAWTAEIKAG